MHGLNWYEFNGKRYKFPPYKKIFYVNLNQEYNQSDIFFNFQPQNIYVWKTKNDGKWRKWNVLLEGGPNWRR